MKNNKEVDVDRASPWAIMVTLDSTSDDEEMYTAVEVRWDKEGTPEERAKASEDWDLPKLVGGPVGKGVAMPPFSASPVTIARCSEGRTPATIPPQKEVLLPRHPRPRPRKHTGAAS